MQTSPQIELQFNLTWYNQTNKECLVSSHHSCAGPSVFPTPLKPWDDAVNRSVWQTSAQATQLHGMTLNTYENLYSAVYMTVYTSIEQTATRPCLQQIWRPGRCLNRDEVSTCAEFPHLVKHCSWRSKLYMWWLFLFALHVMCLLWYVCKKTLVTVKLRSWSESLPYEICETDAAT